MLMITSFANPRVAQAFVDYMATQGVILTIQQHRQSDVWLADETQAARVQAEPHVNPNAQQSEIWLRDPDGYLVVLAGTSQWRPRG